MSRHKGTLRVWHDWPWLFESDRTLVDPADGPTGLCVCLARVATRQDMEFQAPSEDEETRAFKTPTQLLLLLLLLSGA